MGFAWCREQHKSEKHHYHYILLLEGHKKNSPINLQKIIFNTWYSLGQSSISWRAFHNITRLKDEKLNHAIFHASDITKAATKGQASAYTNDFQCSRLKPANDKDINNILKLA